MLLFLLAIVPLLTQDPGLSPAERAAIDRSLTLEADGVEELEVGSGIAIVSCATAYYNADLPNPALVLQGQRYACLEASLRAQGQMLGFFEGLDVASTTELKSKFTSEDSDEASEVTAEFSAAESGVELASGVLKGVVVYQIDDRPDEGAVSIWMASSPKSRASVKRTSARGVNFSDYAKGLDYIVSQVLSGTLPPTGGMLMSVPSTGEVAWIGFGSALVNPTGRKATGRLAGRAKQAALSQSKILANSSLLDCIQGKPVSMEGEFSQKYASLEESMENFVDGTFEAEASAASTTMDRQQLSAVQAGKVPAGVTYKTVTSEDGNWAYTFAILREVKAEEKAVPVKPKAKTEQFQLPDGDAKEEGTVDTAAAVGASDSCDERGKKGVISVRVSMTADSRQGAISAALIEAIQRTNGVQLESSLTMQSRFASADAFVNGEESSMAVAGVSVEENVSTKTAGLIDSYTILSEGPSAEGYSVEVCVLTPSYDPSWRPGGKQVVAILPFESRAQSFSIEGSEQSSSGFTNEMEAVLVDALVATGDFFVIDRRNSQVVEDLLSDIRAGVGSGEMQIREAGKLGQLKGVDILITGSLDELEYRNYKIRIAALKRDEARSSLSVLSQCRMTNVADGTVLGQSYYSNNWGGDTPAQMQDLQEFLGEWRGYEPAGAAFGAAALHHLQEIKKVGETLRNGSRLKVVEYLDDGIVLLEAFRAEFSDELSSGERLQVKWRKATKGGKEFLLNRCVIEVLEVQEGGLVVASFVDGKNPVPGDFAQRMDG